MPWRPFVICSGLPPAWSRSQISSSPLRSETKAIRFPSGDQRACLSCAPEVAVRLRVGPFSVGRVKTSPRATKRARSPFGLSSKPSTCFSALTRDGRRATPSSGTKIERPRSALAFTSKTRSSPFSS